MLTRNDEKELTARMRTRARAIAKAGGLQAAIDAGALPRQIETTLSEALVLGLMKQGVTKYLAIFGHGSTDLGEVLRVYEEEGATRTFNCRNEVAMAHAATALRWEYSEVPAVVTSIGPGAMQALAGSLAAASNGVGVYHIYGDETTFGEGYNMQQVPKEEQGLFGQMTAIMGRSYVLHTPEGVRDALRRGALTVNHPYRAGPFYLLLPLNTQPAPLTLNLSSLPDKPNLPLMAPADDRALDEAARLIAKSTRPMIKAGGGTRGHDAAIKRLAEAAGAAVVLSPGSTGVLPDDAHAEHACRRLQGLDQRQRRDGGSRSGHGDRLARGVSGRLFRYRLQAGRARHQHQRRSRRRDPLQPHRRAAGRYWRGGDAPCRKARKRCNAARGKDTWLSACAMKKRDWMAYKQARYDAAPMKDDAWGKPVLGQPAAIKVVADFAKEIGAAKFFDAGDVQANGFQIVEDDKTGDTYTETGASYMGFAASALLASALADTPRYGIAFSGDGSFIMNPQILIDGVEHGLRGMLVIFDNRRMAAITGLQMAQYGEEFRTNDRVAVDYVALASAVTGVKAVHGGFSVEDLRAALKTAHAHDGLSVVHVPVYCGDNELGGLGAWGQWNVGNWCEDVQATWMAQDL